MPPKVKITKEEIIKTALGILREKGVSSVNARGIADELGCSTQPVFSNFATMDELQSEVMNTAYQLYFGFLEREVRSGKYPDYKAFGMAYIRFAKEERELFKYLFMRDRASDTFGQTPDFERSVEMIMNSNGLTREKAERLHLEMWMLVHGIGTVIATSFLNFEWETISDMLSDVYHGVISKILAEDNVSDCN